MKSDIKIGGVLFRDFDREQLFSSCKYLWKRTVGEFLFLEKELSAGRSVPEIFSFDSIYGDYSSNYHIKQLIDQADRSVSKSVKKQRRKEASRLASQNAYHKIKAIEEQTQRHRNMMRELIRRVYDGTALIVKDGNVITVYEFYVPLGVQTTKLIQII